jgi:hypothetical protein
MEKSRVREWGHPRASCSSRIYSAATEDEALEAGGRGSRCQPARAPLGIGCSGMARARAIPSAKPRSSSIPSEVKPCHSSGLEVDDEEGLAADELLKVLPLSLHTRQDRARVVAEVNGEAYELARPRDVLDGENRPDPDVELLQDLDGHRAFDRRRFHAGSLARIIHDRLRPPLRSVADNLLQNAIIGFLSQRSLAQRVARVSAG